MKRQIISTMISISMVSALLLSGCSKSASDSDNAAKAEPEQTVQEDTKENEAENDQKDEAVEEANDQVEEEEGKGDYLTNIPYITITKNEEDIYDADNNYLVYFENDSVSADSVIEDYSALEDSIKQLSSSMEFSDEDRDYYKQEAGDIISERDPQYIDPEIPITSECREVDQARVDTQMVSLILTDYTYLGGAHGMTVITGASFDTKTGKKLGINDIFDDPEGFVDNFKATSKECIPMIIGEDDGMIWEGYESSVDQVDMSNDAWYFDATGFTYVFGEYELGAYALGNVRVTIGYEQLREFIKADYLPNEDDRIANIYEKNAGVISLKDGIYVSIDNEHNEDYSEQKGIISIGPDSKVITDSGYIQDVYLMKRLDKDYLFLNYTTLNNDYCETDTRYYIDNMAVLDVTDGDMKIIFEENQASYKPSTLTMDTFEMTLVGPDSEKIEERVVPAVLGE